MAKNLKITIKNTQIAEAINLGNLKSKFAKKKEASLNESQAEASIPKISTEEPSSAQTLAEEAKRTPPPSEEAPRIKARSRSAFAETAGPHEDKQASCSPGLHREPSNETHDNLLGESDLHMTPKKKSSEELRRDIFGEDAGQQIQQKKVDEQKLLSKLLTEQSLAAPQPTSEPIIQHQPKDVKPVPPPLSVEQKKPASEEPSPTTKQPPAPAFERLGPTGRHVKDLIPPPRPKPQPQSERPRSDQPRREPFRSGQSHADHSRNDQPRGEHQQRSGQPPRSGQNRDAPGARSSRPPYQGSRPGQSGPGPRGPAASPSPFVEDKAIGRPRDGDIVKNETMPGNELDNAKKGLKTSKFKDFKDVKPARKQSADTSFDARARHGLRDDDDSKPWRKRRPSKAMRPQEDLTIRPSTLRVRIPISIKDLAVEMKLKASQLVQKLFLQGIVATLNDLLEDETIIQLLGHEFGCEISIDTTQEKRLRITDKTIKEEIAETDPKLLHIRPPVVTFMGHVDHGKTSLIDAIRKSNRTAGEAGAITQHIGAFRCSTPVGDIAILDTPGHEAFSLMRARGADVTDIVVLVIAGDEGIRQQTVEAIHHAKQAGVIIIVALNKCDKPAFNPENVYRQLSEHELLPEAWGGQTITVNCSAVTGQGLQELLEMLALQAEVLELKANPTARARGTVLESEMHKGLGAVANILIRNGTLRVGDALVFGDLWARVKTMHDEFGKDLKEAGASTPVEITGMSGLPEAGQEFIVVKTEKEAREIAEARRQDTRQINLQQTKKISMENLMQQATEVSKKILNIVLRTDVQGSLEALKVALQKIESKKASLNIIFADVGEITESDVQLAAASKAVIFGFHTAIESHAENLLKQLGVQVRLHDIIYHAIDDVKQLMVNLLDKIAIETEKGKTEVKAVFKSSQVGLIAGCQVIEGSILRNLPVRLRRKGDIVWKGSISSLKRVKDDVREVQKGLECGVVLNNFTDLQEGDILESYEITYITQEL